jgi:hypothetical protein
MQDLDNGEPDCALSGHAIRVPDSEEDRPGQDVLEWLADTADRG